MEAGRTDIASSEAMPPPEKPDAASKSANASSKRSHDKMNERAERASSRQDDAESDTTKGSIRGKNRANSADSVNTVTNVSQDEGPSLRETDMNTEGLSPQPPQSAQGPVASQPKQKAKSQPKKSKSKKAPKPVQDQPVTDDEAENDLDSSADDVDAPELPDQPIEGFDWNGLIYDYHQKTRGLDQQESDIMEGCRQLMDFFEAWAVVGSRKETARSFKRLKTQMAYVEREEYDLDQKRLHYIQVVNAFKSALQLLANQ
ncbi:hypothetical protein CKM354_000664300 [Cercospora kikuchii]|uniref:Uncharacterized protein n=1 Tax=Cercospora kikuchii TaxID=84275 RepID=A0A9P3CMY1_9PEZI|nr:uncharacterized protein CKM354_000664300 [Cercospora kikuchii]GIZ43415.1 hypothetical protein CKM354_000664300 [Cercospora kikuchii]